MADRGDPPEPMDTEGPGEASTSERTTDAAEPAAVVHVACGSSHSLALLSTPLAASRFLKFRSKYFVPDLTITPLPGSDIALSWGRGEDGQLGHGDAEERYEPQAIYALIGAGATSVHSGAEYSLACCRQRREVYSWGW